MYSFDIFDTLITRCTAEPKGIFMLVQQFMKTSGEYDSFLTDNFYELRVGAEALARACAASRGRYEVTLDDIYTALSTTACITEKQQENLKHLEIETECNNVLGLTKNIALLKELLNQGHRVVLISDMYLGEKNIRRMLERVDSVFEGLPLYVSSDYGAAKGSGLFQIVKDKERADYSGWIHYGDNEYADVKMAAKLGITAVHLNAGKLKEYEQPQKDVYYQLSVGVSRYIRLTGTGDAVEEVGCSLAGPILYPYARWLLEKSRKSGINRLYFVARDGWILKQIADVIIQMRGYSIKTHYIYGSRKAWRLPSYEGSRKDLERVFRWSNMDEVLCLKDFAIVLQLEVEELKKFLPDENKEIDAKQRIFENQKENLCRQLLDNADFREYLMQSQKENKRLLLEYLKQEMDVSDDRFAFVELSGTGFTQKCLADVMGAFYQGEIKNFYFKLDYIQENGKCKFINFYPNSMKRNYMLELLCRAPHGQTEVYAEKDGCIVPVLELSEGEQIKAYGLERYRDAVIAYVSQMENVFIRNDLSYVACISIVREYMSTIAENPPDRIAGYFRHMPFSSGGRKNSMVEFAPPITKRQLREIYLWKNGENYRRIYQGNSLDYALAISAEAKNYMEKCLKYRETKTGKWLVDWERYLRTRQRPGTKFFCPWEFLKGKIVIYGAGQVGQAYVKQAKQRRAKCESLLWVDSNYVKLQGKGFDVKSPEEIKNFPYDRIIVAIHNASAKREIDKRLREMRIETGKVYYG